MKTDQKLIPFSPTSLTDSTLTRQLKIQRKATSLKRSQSSLEPFAGLPESLVRRLLKLDREQLQIMEIIAAAFLRGML